MLGSHHRKSSIHISLARLSLVLKLVVSHPAAGPLQSFLDIANGRDDLEVVGVARTGRETVEAIRTTGADALVFSDEWTELCRAIRVSLGLASGHGPAFIVGADEPNPALIVKSALYGFDGAVPARSRPELAIPQILEIANGAHSIAEEPVVRELGIQTGVLAKRVIITDRIDNEIADLVAAGLGDDDIAVITESSIQFVRNRIENLVHVNGLTHRTQLAVLKAASWEVPDFT